MIDRKKYNYIAWRSRAIFMTYSALMGGFPINSDTRFWNTKGSSFVLTCFEEGCEQHYAVSDADAEAFIKQVLQHCGPDNGIDGIDQFVIPDADGPGAVASVTISARHYPFDDPALLKKWMDELRSKCTGPMDPREFYHYTNPVPEPVKGDVIVETIVEQAVVPPQPPALPVPPPDNCRSSLYFEGGKPVLKIYCSGKYYTYDLPEQLLPEVNAAAAQLIAHPADGYHVHWEPEAWITVKGRVEQFIVEPEGVLKLFEKLAAKCMESSKSVQPLPGGIGYRSASDCAPGAQGWPGSMSMMFQMNSEAAKQYAAGKDTQGAGNDAKAAGKDAQAAGNDVQASGQKAQAPGQKAQAAVQPDKPWVCPMCGNSNTGKFCNNCGSLRP